MDDISVMALIVLTMTVIAIVLSYLSWSGSNRPFRIAFIGLMISESIINWSYFLGILAKTMDEKLMWNNFEYFGYLFAAVFFLIFALLYTRNKYATTRNFAILFITSIMFLAIVATDQYHHLFYTNVMISENHLITFEEAYGPLFYAFAIYEFTVIMIGMMILVKHYLKASKTQRTGIGLIALYGLISLASVLIYLAFEGELAAGIIIMGGFIIGSIPLFIGAFSFELFELLPFANDMVMDTMQDGVIVLDDNERVLFINRSIERLSGKLLQDLNQDHVSKLLPSFPADAFALTKTVEGRLSRPVLKVEGGYFELDVSTIKDQTGSMMGKLVLVRDITLRKNAEEDAKMTHEKLDLLNTITRHDIKNQLVLLDGHLGLMRSKNTDSDIVRHIESSMRSAQNIEKQIEFAKDYQDLGRRTPTWQSLDGIFNNIGKLQDLRKINVSLDTKGIEVLADPLLSKVFYNLVDNSLTHGGAIENITFKATVLADHLDIIYQDDGVGIPDEKKNKIFDKGFGRNSGLGLFISKEILRIGGMDIVEDGEPGKGARFRITIPKGNYRFIGK